MGLTFPGSPPPDDYPGHGALQRVDLDTGAVTDLYEACDGNPLRAPNDLVLDADGGIWFTDHGVRTERASDRTGAYYAARRRVVDRRGRPPARGARTASGCRRAATGSTWPRPTPGGCGRGTSTARAGSRARTRSGPGGAILLADPGDFTLFDSLAVDAAGWVCVATLVQGRDHLRLARRQRRGAHPPARPADDEHLLLRRRRHGVRRRCRAPASSCRFAWHDTLTSAFTDFPSFS